MGRSLVVFLCVIGISFTVIASQGTEEVRNFEGNGGSGTGTDVAVKNAETVEGSSGLEDSSRNDVMTSTADTPSVSSTEGSSETTTVVKEEAEEHKTETTGTTEVEAPEMTTSTEVVAPETTTTTGVEAPETTTSTEVEVPETAVVEEGSTEGTETKKEEGGETAVVAEGSTEGTETKTEEGGETAVAPQGSSEGTETKTEDAAVAPPESSEGTETKMEEGGETTVAPPGSSEGTEAKTEEGGETAVAPPESSEGTETKTKEGGKEVAQGDDGKIEQSGGAFDDTGVLESVGGMPLPDVEDSPGITCLSCMELDTSKESFDPLGIFGEGEEENKVAKVYKDRKLMGPWEFCAIEDANLDNTCFVDDEYTDAIQFRIFFGFKKQLFHEIPKVRVISGETAHPNITGISAEEDEYSGKFTVRYNCDPADKAKNLLEATISINENEEVILRWLKVCGSGNNVKVDVGFITHDKFELEMPLFSVNESAMIVDSTDASTTIYMKLLAPARLQYHAAPVVTVSDPTVLNITTRGFGSMAGSLTAITSTFDINYQCLQEGSVALTLQIAIPPFDDIVKRWSKNCAEKRVYTMDESGDGATNSTDSVVLEPLEVGTSYYSKDVMMSGSPTSEYTMEYSFGSLHASSYTKVVPPSASSLTFYLRNPATSMTAQIIDRVSITVQNNSIVHATVTKPYVARLYMTASGGDIAPAETAKLRLYMICKEMGSTPVLVTLASLHHHNIEFGFVKECLKPAKHVARSTFRTAQSLLQTIAWLAVIIACGVVYFYRKSKAGAKKERDRNEETRRRMMS